MKLSVVMPVYNGQDFLKESIDSILGQTYSDFEFLIIDDGSTDNSKSIIEEYQSNDARIKLLGNKYQKGIVGALNTGIENVSGEYIARMDADDISLPDRFEKQVEFMEKNPEVGLLGGQWINFGMHDAIYPMDLEDKDLRIRMFFFPVVHHPLVIMRTKVLKKNNLKYESKYQYAEDHKLWCEILKVSKVANLPDVLLKYRVHANSSSIAKMKEQLAAWSFIVRENLENHFKMEISDDILKMLFELANIDLVLEGKVPSNFPNDDWKPILIKWLQELIEVNKKKNIFNPEIFEEKLSEGIMYLQMLLQQS